MCRNKSLAQKELKAKLGYNPNTGEFFRKEKTAQCVNIGDLAGTINNNGYLVISINNVLYLGHHLAWLYTYGTWPKNQLDHIDQDRSNNKISNLREVDHQTNHRNQKISKNNRSGFAGVAWSKKQDMWRAYITIDGKQKHLGFFNTKNQAISARISANNKYGFHKNHGKK